MFKLEFHKVVWNQLLFSNSLVLDKGHSLFLLLLGLNACHVSELQELRLRDLLLLCVSVSGTRLCKKNSNASGVPLRLGQGSLWCTAEFPEALDGNRRKQTEPDGNRLKHTESRGIRFGASLVVVSWPSSQLRGVVLGKNRPKIKTK